MFKDRFYMLISSIFVVLILAYIISFINPTWRTTVFVFIYLIVAILPILTYIPYLKIIGFDWVDKFSVMVFLQWLGTLIWFFAGITLLIYYGVLLGIEPEYPSISEFIYIVGYIPVIVGLSLYVLNLYREFGVKPSKTQTMILLSLALGLSIFISFVYWSLVSHYPRGATSAEYMVNSAYVVLDGALLFVILMGVFIVGGRLGRVMSLFMVSAILVVVYDMLFTLLEIQNVYFVGHPIDFIAYSAYLIYALAFWEVGRIVKR